MEVIILETKEMKRNPNPMAPEIRALPGLEFRERAEGDKTIRTIAGVIKYDTDSVIMRDLYGDEFVEQIAKGAFDQSLRENRILVLWSHDTRQVLASTANKTLRLESKDDGLHFEADLADTTAGRDAWESIKRGDVDGTSFGFIARNDKWSKEDRGQGKKPLYRRTILDADLREISPVAFPAYPANSVHVRSLDEYRESLLSAELEERKRRLSIELELL